MSTKIHATVDALGNPTGVCSRRARLMIWRGADALLAQVQSDVVIADKAFDAEERVIKPLEEAGKTAVIPSRQNRAPPRPYDKTLYAERGLIETCFCTLKQFRAIATRYDKTARNFLAAIHLAATAIWLN